MIDYAFWWYWFCRHFRVCSRDCSRLRMTYNVAMSACERWRDVFLLWEGMRWGDKVASCICVVGDSLENNRLMRFQEVPWTITAFWCINICIYVSLHWHTTIFTATCIYKYIYIYSYIHMLVSHPLLNWTLSCPQHLLLHPFSVYQIHPKPPKTASFFRQKDVEANVISFNVLLSVGTSWRCSQLCLEEMLSRWEGEGMVQLIVFFWDHDTNMCKHWITFFLLNLYTILQT